MEAVLFKLFKSYCKQYYNQILVTVNKIFLFCVCLVSFIFLIGQEQLGGVGYII